MNGLKMSATQSTHMHIDARWSTVLIFAVIVFVVGCWTKWYCVFHRENPQWNVSIILSPAITFFSLFVSRLSPEYDDTFVAHVSMWKRDRQTQLTNFISKVRHLVAKPTHETCTNVHRKCVASEIEWERKREKRVKISWEFHLLIVG